MSAQRFLMSDASMRLWFSYCITHRHDFDFSNEGVKRYQEDPDRYDRLGWRRLADDVEADRCAARHAKAKSSDLESERCIDCGGTNIEEATCVDCMRRDGLENTP